MFARRTRILGGTALASLITASTALAAAATPAAAEPPSGYYTLAFSDEFDGTSVDTSLDYAAGSTGWVKVGSWHFGAGTGGSVTLTRGNGNARADAVKFVRES